MCLTNVTVAFMPVLLPVYHVASYNTVHTLACIHVQGFEMLDYACPSIAGGHQLFCETLGAIHSQLRLLLPWGSTDRQTGLPVHLR